MTENSTLYPEITGSPENSEIMLCHWQITICTSFLFTHLSFPLLCLSFLCVLKDGNGYIDRYELATMLRFMGETISEEEIRDIIEEADVDNDGLIDYSEFYNMMCAGSTPKKTGIQHQ